VRNRFSTGQAGTIRDEWGGPRAQYSLWRRMEHAFRTPESCALVVFVPPPLRCRNSPVFVARKQLGAKCFLAPGIIQISDRVYFGRNPNYTIWKPCSESTGKCSRTPKGQRRHVDTCERVFKAQGRNGGEAHDDEPINATMSDRVGARAGGVIIEGRVMIGGVIGVLTRG
jgi:hypothetical protein